MQELKEIFRAEKKPLGLIREQVDGKEVVKLRGPFQEMNDIRGNKNKNGRVYSKDLWEKALSDKGFQERLTGKRILGELDHPSDDGQIRRTSHIVTKVWPDYNEGVIYGELELLNHDQGDAALLRALVEQGVQICVSSRGFGDFLKDGCTVDPETYKLHTWDVVLDPSVAIATLNRVAESVNQKLANESKSRSGFFEVDRPGWVGEANQDSNTNDQPLTSEKESIQMEQVLKLMEEKSVLAVDKAKLEANNESMRSLITEKNASIDKLDKALNATNEKFVASEAKVAELTLALAKANEKATAAESTLKEYESIEERAISTIRGLRETVAQYDRTGDKAADLIESLKAQLRSKKTEGKGKKGKNEDTDDLNKVKGASGAGKLRTWEPGDKGGTKDDLIDKGQDQQDEEADDELDIDPETGKPRVADEEAEPEIDPKTGKPVAKTDEEEEDDHLEPDGDEDDGEQTDEEEEDGEPDGDEKPAKPGEKGKEEKSKGSSMLAHLSESMVRDLRPRKLSK